MAILCAIKEIVSSWVISFLRILFLVPFVTGFDGCAGVVVQFFYPNCLAVISTLWISPLRDAELEVDMQGDSYLYRSLDPFYSLISLSISSAIGFPFRFYNVLVKMADNLRRAVQDINLRADDVPIAIPADVVANAVAENRFILMGRPVMPRRQNLRSIIASMPRVWGQSGLVHGRIVGGNQFQFIFPSEESLVTVLRRGPWAFNDRLLVLQRWYPLENPPLINFIPFWVQIRGIPFQFLNREVISHIGRSIGNLLEVDYDGEAAARVEFVRVQISWDILLPLRFQRQFQFQVGINTLLRFRYERLRGFCEVCGMMTHDTGACVLQNGGGEPFPDEDDDDEEMPPPPVNRNPELMQMTILLRSLEVLRSSKDTRI
ncbi:hypothetical protein CARUB_v10012496mg [Capsella rubella]|uniref:DUF4283 domain-containing protein n=1 Tax=Capsella rubella TaxID=81985 RepID=R0IIL1_9BRAS|nr:hypothetical protein CARUB_v10012496mg [Capsella rubella]